MSLNIYPEEVHKAELGDPAYYPEIDQYCDEIHDACKGLGTDERALIDILGTKNAVERSLIAFRYPQMHSKKLKDLMKKETSGDFGFATQLLALPCIEAEAKIIRKATKGLGTNEKLLYSVICGRSNMEMDILKKAFFSQYNKDLISVTSSEVSGDLKKLLVACLQGMEETFDPTYHTDSKAKEDAYDFYKKGVGKKFGTDEAALFEIICKSPPEYLKMIDAAYVSERNVNLEKALVKCLRGKAEAAAVFHLNMKLKPYETIATLIKSTCAGMGTDELGLTCAVIRYQHVLQQVTMAHIDLFGKTVGDRIVKETSGDFEKLLLEIVRVAWPDTPAS